MRRLAVALVAFSAVAVAGVRHARADAPVTEGGHRVDGVAGLVGGTAPGIGVATILRSDVELVARIALGAESSASLAPLPREVLAATLDRIVGETLIAREAERVRVTVPTDADVAAERARLEESAGGASAMRALLELMDASLAEVDAIARRRATVAAFLRANLEGSTVVGDSEVEELYASGQHPLTDQTLDEARDALRALLARRALDRAVARWVGVLRARTPTRILSFAR